MTGTPSAPVIVIGAGIGGLAAALVLAARGREVLVLERAGGPGGKARQVEVAGRKMDAGPTVFTLKDVFEGIFAEAGVSLDASLKFTKAEVLARHGWQDGSRFDLYADPERSTGAIAEFACGEEAKRFEAFCKEARRLFQSLDQSFMRQPDPGFLNLACNAPLPDLMRTRAFGTLWGALGKYFKDVRLRQLFGRYATYCGSSPFEAPGTLMLIAHAELAGVWLLEGGIHALAQALAAEAERQGAILRYGAGVAKIEVIGGRASAVILENGERIAAGGLIYNGDTGALAAGMLGKAVASAVPGGARYLRTLSAVTWNLSAEVEGFPLSRHTVFFSKDYPEEFRQIRDDGRIAEDPTIYICAQDRNDEGGDPQGAERLLCLINAPATGDRKLYSQGEVDDLTNRLTTTLARHGLTLRFGPQEKLVTTPSTFEQLFPGTGGALYGRASHGWSASFQRPGVRSRLPGLYFAGGSVHPGAGLPMVALSGHMAAKALLSETGS